MDLFRLGLRNFMGVLLPGAVLVLLFIYVLLTGAFSMGITLHFSSLSQGFPLAALFLVSYLIGSLLRLNSADNVDSKSAAYQQWQLRAAPSSRSEIVKVLKYIVFSIMEAWGVRHKGSHHNSQPNATPADDLNKWWESDELAKPGRINPADVPVDTIWRIDLFPYPVWHFVKLKLFHPVEAYSFFWVYRDYMRCHDHPKKLGKEFFNFCKTAILHRSNESASLVCEVQTAEAQVRFYAGTYYALVVGNFVLWALILWQIYCFIHNHLVVSPTDLKTLNIGATLVLIFCIYAMRLMIIERFRTLRLKEVDTVYDSFYLLHWHPETCEECSGFRIGGNEDGGEGSHESAQGAAV
jgi:hypothetical protein